MITARTHVIDLPVGPGVIPPCANAEPTPTGPPMKRKPEIELTPFPTAPPAPPTAAQINKRLGILTHQDKELRAVALNLALHSIGYSEDGLSALYELADEYLVYINGDQP